MNALKNRIVITVAAICTLMLLFPPFVGMGQNQGYGFLFNPPNHGFSEIELERLIVQLVVVVILGYVAFLVLAEDGKKLDVNNASASGGIRREFDPNEPRPWRRYWARTFDILFYLIPITALLLSIELTQLHLRLGAQLVIFAFFIFLGCGVGAAFIESIIVSVFGNTPGKALFALKLKNCDGSRLSFDQCLSRSLSVLWRGLGLMLPLVEVFTKIASYRRLVKYGKTYWDEEYSSTVIGNRSPA